MSSSELLTFTGALFLMVIVPGPGILACVSRALASGFNRAVFVALGIIVGDLFFLLMAITGLAAIAELLGSFFAIVKYGGALYLIWLGYRTWTSKVDLRTKLSGKGSSRRACFLSGLSVTLSNPKAIGFYLSFLPAFLDLRRLSSSDVLTAATIIILTLAVVLLTYSYAANHIRSLFSSEKATKSINRCAGTAMISVGVAIAVKR